MYDLRVWQRDASAVSEVELDIDSLAVILQELRHNGVDRPCRRHARAVPYRIRKGVVVKHQRGNQPVQEIVGAHVRIGLDRQNPLDLAADMKDLRPLTADMLRSEFRAVPRYCIWRIY